MEELLNMSVALPLKKGAFNGSGPCHGGNGLR
jgi:hypothetical protein